jgi:hypothetical protein
MAFTSGIDNAGSDTSHIIEVQADAQVRSLVLHDRPGDDMQENKGDLWKIDFSDFQFTDGCITIGEISGASIVENGNDGWNIDSIATLVKDNRGGVELLTQDLDVFRWIDGDDLPQYRRFDLTLA